MSSMQHLNCIEREDGSKLLSKYFQIFPSFSNISKYKIFKPHRYNTHTHTHSFTKSVIHMCLSFSCQSEVQRAICNRRIRGNEAEESNRQNHCNKWEAVWMWKGNWCIETAHLYNVQKHRSLLILTLQRSGIGVISRSRSSNGYP